MGKDGWRSMGRAERGERGSRKREEEGRNRGKVDMQRIVGGR